MDTYHSIRIGPTLEFADTLFAYAAMLRAADQQNEAVTLLQQSSSIYRKLSPDTSLMTTISEFVLASALFESGDAEEALNALNQCLGNFRRLYGSSGKAIVEPPVIGDILNYIGSIKQVDHRNTSTNVATKDIKCETN